MKKMDLFLELYEEICSDLYHFAFYTLRSQQDAEDVVQDCVISAYEQFEGLRKVESFRPWIFKILIRQCKKKMKDYYNQTATLDEKMPAPESNIAENMDLKRALDLLSEEDRKIVLLSIYGGYSSKEIAWILKKNPNTVRSRFSRAMQKMQVYMK